MHKIKVRAWNKVTGKMINLYKVTPFALDPDFKQDGLFIPFNDDLILEQWAGRQDVNGVDIYEGDIVEYVPWRTPVVVSVVSDGHRFEFWDHRKDESRSFALHMPVVKIIGNIHENWELLKIPV